MEVETYPEMNKKIKELLRLEDDPVSLYAATRIEELEKEVIMLTVKKEDHKQYKNLNRNSFEYQQSYKEGKRRERGLWVTAIEKTKGIGDKLAERIMEEAVKLNKRG